MNYKKLSLGMAVALSITSLNAYEMRSVGYKATGMGGAGVASSRGSLATYYNPALLGVSDYTTEISLNAGISIRENKLVDTVDKLNNLDLNNTIDRIANNAPTSGTNSKNGNKDSENIQEALSLINKIPAGNGLQIIPSVSLSAQMSRYFAIGAYASSEIRAKMVIDRERLRIIVKDEDNNAYYSYDPVNDTYNTSTEASYKSDSIQYALEGDSNTTMDATTYLNVNAMTTAEVPVSFAYPIDTQNGLLSLGITAKAMAVETFSKDFDIDTDSNNIKDDYEENKKTYNAIGVDLGVAYRENKTGLTIGLVGKNINKPTFETKPDTNGKIETFTLDPFFRAGLSLPVWNDNVEFAIDADLQQSDTSYEGMKSQYVGGGMEFHPASWFALRAGAMKNVATESINEGFIYTAGLGFGLKWLQFDLSAQMAQEKGRYDGNDIPKYVAVNFSLISRWGDGYKRKVPPTLNETPTTIEETKTPLSTDEIDRINNDAKKAHQELDQTL